LLALIFFASLANQAMLAPNAMDGHVREGQIEFALQARGTESGQLLTESDDLLFEGERCFMRAVMMSATELA
jgi:hypothetical protein